MTQEQLPPIDRRKFIRLTSTSIGLVATGSLGILYGCAPEDALVAPSTDPLMARGGIPGPPDGTGGTSWNLLRIPNKLSVGGATLTTAPATVDLGGGRTSDVWAYNGSFPGPTLEARTGQTASITLINGLSDESITHWHGMIVDDDNDGHPRFAIAGGESRAYSFPILDRARLNWYHPHPHGMTGEQVAMGLAGAFIIRDSDDDAVMSAIGGREIPLIIRDARFDKSGNIQYRAKRGGYDGDTPLVNGTIDAGIDVDPAVYRLRILNGSNARIYRLALDDGSDFHLIGNDGGFLGAPVQLSEITIAPAERVDVLVDLGGYQSSSVILKDLASGWDLVTFAVGTGADAGSTSVSLPSLETLVAPAGATVREFSFDGMSRINGQLFDMDRIDFEVPAGTVERWIFTTNGNAPHPVHVHLDPFQVQSRSGGRGQVFPWEAGWKDTVLLEDGETVEILVRFSANPGTGGIYLMHCHKLEHEDMGMMLNFKVV